MNINIFLTVFEQNAIKNVIVAYIISIIIIIHIKIIMEYVHYKVCPELCTVYT